MDLTRCCICARGRVGWRGEGGEGGGGTAVRGLAYGLSCQHVIISSCFYKDSHRQRSSQQGVLGAVEALEGRGLIPPMLVLLRTARIVPQAARTGQSEG